ncbi:hypothetical protein DSO57_1003299 [Entomophthora muscae]|uniref:Uncharacterized protein n=1 Tax=Entomophthora muscae TaxID=34485 RepID=A0ACC2T845_9FUNG|nr:hypothetical protein DSO57_1003299 [Entomophthora muscae]
MHGIVLLATAAVCQYFGPLMKVFDMVPIAPPSADPVKTQMPLPSIPTIHQFMWYASAPGCNDKRLDNWTCIACRLANKNAQHYMTLTNPSFNTRGVIALDHKARNIIVSFRGTRDAINVMSDVNFFPTHFKHAPVSGNLVHSGFLNAMESLSPQYIPALKRLRSSPHYQQYKIVVTGHSLGGAMACLAAVKIKDVFQVPWSQMELLTYGQPRTGNRAFARWLDAQPLSSARVVNYNDIVPHLMGAFVNDFVHQQNEVFIDRVNEKRKLRICNNKIFEDPKCSNKVPPSEYSVIAHVSYMNPGFINSC